MSNPLDCWFYPPRNSWLNTTKSYYWWFGTCLIFHFIYGMSSFPLTFTPSFFKMVKLHHQPEYDTWYLIWWWLSPYMKYSWYTQDVYGIGHANHLASQCSWAELIGKFDVHDPHSVGALDPWSEYAYIWHHKMPYIPLIPYGHKMRWGFFCIQKSWEFTEFFLPRKWMILWRFHQEKWWVEHRKTKKIIGSPPQGKVWKSGIQPRTSKVT